MLLREIDRVCMLACSFSDRMVRTSTLVESRLEAVAWTCSVFLLIQAPRCCLSQVVGAPTVSPTLSPTALVNALDVADALRGSTVWVSGGVRGADATCGLLSGDTTCDLSSDTQGAVQCGTVSTCESLECVNEPFRPTPVHVLEVAPETAIGVRVGSREVGDATLNTTSGTATFSGRGRVEVAIPPENGTLEHLGVSAWLRAQPGLPQR